MGQNTHWVDLTPAGLDDFNPGCWVDHFTDTLGENTYIAGLNLKLGYSMSHFNHCFYRNKLLFSDKHANTQYKRS